MRLELAGRRPLLSHDLRIREVDHGWLVIDARRLEFAGPLELAGLVAYGRTCAAGGAQIAIAIPQNPAVASYLQRMDVFRRLPTGTEIDGALPGERRTDLGSGLLEVCPISDGTSDDIANRLGRIVTASLAPQVGTVVFSSMCELVGNAVSHGASTTGGYIAAQTYTGATSGTPGIELAICDTGIGVLEHLTRNPEYEAIKTAAEALECAMKPGVTGTSEQQRGYGLHDLARVISRGGQAELVLRSAGGMVTVCYQGNGSGRKVLTASPAIQGTWAWLRVRYP